MDIPNAGTPTEKSHAPGVQFGFCQSTSKVQKMLVPFGRCQSTSRGFSELYADRPGEVSARFRVGRVSGPDTSYGRRHVDVATHSTSNHLRICSTDNMQLIPSPGVVNVEKSGVENPDGRPHTDETPRRPFWQLLFLNLTSISIVSQGRSQGRRTDALFRSR